jgi:uncharacterized protein YgiM (DUF1202 family)
MRTPRVIVGCLLTAALVLAPAIAWAAAGSKKSATHPTTAAGTGPTVSPYTPATPPTGAAAKAPAKSSTPAFPAPAAPATPATPPAAVPALPAVPAMPTAPAMTGLTPAAPPEAEPPSHPAFPYSGHINADAVNVRSGPGLYYYPLTVLNKNVSVVVEGESGGWLAVRPPEGTYGLMHKGDLTAAPAAKTATVSAPSARVYASSDSAKRQWCVLATLKQGDTVQVLGTAEGDMVKVVPPEGSRVYVAAQYVEAGAGQAGPSAIAQLTELPKPDPMIEEFKKAEAALDAEQRKPLGERDYKAAAAKFQEIAAKTDKPYLRSAADERLAVIKALEEQQDDYVKVESIRTRLEKRLADLKAEGAAKAAEDEREKTAARPEFVATGMVKPLEMMENVDYPIKFKLVDQGDHPLVVLKSTTYDLNKYVGKVVGVRGPKTYLKDWKIYLVTVDDLEVLE